MSFDEDAAAIYDENNEPEDAAVDFLAGLANGGPALELAIGTGRIALPLAQHGIRVDGIDISAAMVAKLRAKPGGGDIAVTMGNFAEVPVDGRYRLIYIVYNTLFNLLTQDEQVRCFENVAEHLTEDGVFVVEAFVPSSVLDIREEQYIHTERVRLDEVRLDVARHDWLKQTLTESHVSLTSAGLRLYPIVTRYAWPSELDLMARIAGLSLTERWSGWHREPASRGGQVVSVYGRR